MRLLLIGPIAVVLVVAASGFALCKSLGLDVHARSMVLAIATATLAYAAGAVPIVLSRRGVQGVVAQAGLLATGAHLLIAATVGFVAIALLRADAAFVYWILPLYWATLTALVVAAVRAVNRAPATPTMPGSSATITSASNPSAAAPAVAGVQQ